LEFGTKMFLLLSTPEVYHQRALLMSFFWTLEGTLTFQLFQGRKKKKENINRRRRRSSRRRRRRKR
jgi:hypothetical protein